MGEHPVRRFSVFQLPCLTPFWAPCRRSALVELPTRLPHRRGFSATCENRGLRRHNRGTTVIRARVGHSLWESTPSARHAPRSESFTQLQDTYRELFFRRFFTPNFSLLPFGPDPSSSRGRCGLGRPRRRGFDPGSRVCRLPRGRRMYRPLRGFHPDYRR